MHGDVVIDGRLQLGHAGEHAAPDALVGDVAKESLDHVEPGSAGGREMDVKARVPGQPGQHLGVLVRGVVVNDQVQLLGLGCVAIDLLEKPQPLLVPMELVGH